MNAQKKWRSHIVDAELQDDWLARANRLYGLELTSICAGHGEEKRHYDRLPHMIFTTYDINVVKIVLNALNGVTKVEWMTWVRRGVSHVNGILRHNWRELGFTSRDLEEVDHYHIGIYGPANTKRNKQKVLYWWEDVLSILEEAL